LPPLVGDSDCEASEAPDASWPPEAAPAVAGTDGPLLPPAGDAGVPPAGEVEVLAVASPTEGRLRWWLASRLARAGPDPIILPPIAPAMPPARPPAAPPPMPPAIAPPSGTTIGMIHAAIIGARAIMIAPTTMNMTTPNTSPAAPLIASLEAAQNTQ